jgi:carbon monoxide dehydrogenase subunit G
MAYRFERSVTIAASPEALWKVVQEPARRTEWDLRVTQVELLTPRLVGKGSRFGICYDFWGTPVRLVIELISWQPYQRSGIKMVGGEQPGTLASSWNFAVQPDGTTSWTTRLTITVPGQLGWLREQLVGHTIEWLTVRSQRNLKQLIEAEQRASAIPG